MTAQRTGRVPFTFVGQVIPCEVAGIVIRLQWVETGAFVATASYAGGFQIDELRFNFSTEQAARGYARTLTLCLNAGHTVAECIEAIAGTPALEMAA